MEKERQVDSWGFLASQHDYQGSGENQKLVLLKKVHVEEKKGH